MMEATVLGFQLWVKAVEKAKSTATDAVGAAIIGLEVPNLTGIGSAKMLANHHLSKPVLIGEIRADGQFDIVWQTPGLVKPDSFSSYLHTPEEIKTLTGAK